MNCVSIYKITCRTTQKSYVGSTTSVKKRQYYHFSQLKKKTHCNKKLQEVYSIYGENDFYFEILETNIQQDDRVSREQYWIDYLNSYQDGYNVQAKSYAVQKSQFVSSMSFNLPIETVQSLKEISQKTHLKLSTIAKLSIERWALSLSQ